MSLRVMVFLLRSGEVEEEAVANWSKRDLPLLTFLTAIGGILSQMPSKMSYLRRQI